MCYGKDFVNYKKHNKKESNEQLSIFRNVYLRNWRNFRAHPILGIKFVGYNSLKYGAGGFGLLVGKSREIKFRRPPA